MTKKHFEAIAAILKANPGTGNVALALAEYFGSVNARFDRGRFLAACGWPGDEEAAAPAHGATRPHPPLTRTRAREG